ncbi:MAG: hypothetical protein M1829_000242 [Trizodia sp. TS-e1964]|nr:MAG: hypothetical protein M1829_000242 [Trizodia sp. TS-e1964]
MKASLISIVFSYYIPLVAGQSIVSIDTAEVGTSQIAKSINSLLFPVISTTLSFSVPTATTAPSTTQPATKDGPYVSDITSSFSEYQKTHTGTAGSLFSFNTGEFLAN